MDRERAEKWISISTSEAWRIVVEELQEARVGFLKDLLVKENPAEVDMFYKGAIFLCDIVLNQPVKADQTLNAEPDELEEIYTSMDTTS